MYPLLIIIVTVGFYYLEKEADRYTVNSDADTTEEFDTNFYYLPTSTTGSVIAHNHYFLSYSEKHEQAEWVAYHLKKEHLSSNEFKRPYFEIDNKVKTSSADWRNYKNSGYDRGHLCPAADRRFTYKAFEETFLTSNVTPQDHKFNSGIWNDLEQKVRYWAKMYDGVYVVTGGILSNDLKSIGYEAVSVPEYFYKIVFNKSDREPKMIAFLMEGKDSTKSLKEFAVTVDQIEQLTGIDFFPSLEDDVEERLEASVIVNAWKF